MVMMINGNYDDGEEGDTKSIKILLFHLTVQQMIDLKMLDRN